MTSYESAATNILEGYSHDQSISEEMSLSK